MPLPAQNLAETDALLQINNLCVKLPPRTAVRATASQSALVPFSLKNIDLQVVRGEVLAILGPSGSGKSTLANAIVREVPVLSGEIWFAKQQILALPAAQFRRLRPKIQVVMQDAALALDPRLSVFDSIAEALRLNRNYASQLGPRVAELLHQVALSTEFLRRYPSQLSGGERQRVNLARALALQPELLICDEATSALDMPVQAQIINLLARLKAEFKLTLLFITHDEPLARYFADRLIKLKAGQIVQRESLAGAP